MSFNGSTFKVIYAISLLDMIIRYTVSAFDWRFDFMFLTIAPVYNYSFLGGLYNDLSSVAVRLITFLMLPFSISVLVFIRNINQKSFSTFKSFFYILFFSYFMNFLEKILFGRVTDYISVDRSTYFNVADIMQVACILSLSYILIFKSKDLFPKNEYRKKYIVDSSNQVRFIRELFVLFTIAYSFSSVLFIIFIHNHAPFILNNNIISFMSFLLFLYLGLLVVLAFFVIELSNRIFAPVLKIINAHRDNEVLSKLRARDYFKNYEGVKD